MQTECNQNTKCKCNCLEYTIHFSSHWRDAFTGITHFQTAIITMPQSLLALKFNVTEPWINSKIVFLCFGTTDALTSVKQTGQKL